MTQTDSFELNSLSLDYESKTWEKYVSKNRIVELVDYKKSFWSSVTRGKSDCWLIIINNQWQHYSLQKMYPANSKKKCQILENSGLFLIALAVLVQTCLKTDSVDPHQVAQNTASN